MPCTGGSQAGGAERLWAGAAERQDEPGVLRRCGPGISCRSLIGLLRAGRGTPAAAMPGPPLPNGPHCRRESNTSTRGWRRRCPRRPKRQSLTTEMGGAVAAAPRCPRRARQPPPPCSRVLCAHLPPPAAPAVLTLLASDSTCSHCLGLTFNHTNTSTTPSNAIIMPASHMRAENPELPLSVPSPTAEQPTLVFAVGGNRVGMAPAASERA